MKNKIKIFIFKLGKKNSAKMEFDFADYLLHLHML